MKTQELRKRRERVRGHPASKCYSWNSHPGLWASSVSWAQALLQGRGGSPMPPPQLARCSPWWPWRAQKAFCLISHLSACMPVSRSWAPRALLLLFGQRRKPAPDSISRSLAYILRGSSPSSNQIANPCPQTAHQPARKFSCFKYLQELTAPNHSATTSMVQAAISHLD